jgi:Holliday junction resolvase
MTAAVQYLEAAKLDELAQQLERDGYNVARSFRDGNVVYDLVATRGDRKVAIEVTARSALRQAVESIRQLREQARRNGFDEFRLVVVSPPRERAVEIAGLEDVLLQHMRDNFPAKLAELSSHTSLDAVSQIDVSSIEVSADGIHVIGTGIVEVTLGYGGEPRDGVSWEADLPFDFDVLLDHQLQIAEVHALEIDTSSFDE